MLRSEWWLLSIRWLVLGWLLVVSAAVKWRICSFLFIMWRVCVWMIGLLICFMLVVEVRCNGLINRSVVVYFVTWVVYFELISVWWCLYIIIILVLGGRGIGVIVSVW